MLAGLALVGWECRLSHSEVMEGIQRYRERVLPILAHNCYVCHGAGNQEGGMSFDRFDSEAALLQDRSFWLKVLKNLRAGVMPPHGLPRLTDADMEQLRSWIYTDVFQIDPHNPDPGYVTLRRLNRIEYANTIRDLMGVEFNAEAEFPPDDTGYGFDNIADVLSVSPLLLEKYLQAAETIVSQAVPTVTKVLPERRIDGGRLTHPGHSIKGDRMSFYEPAEVGCSIDVEHAGEYRVLVSAEVDGSFDYDPGRCEVTIEFDDIPVLTEEYEWHADKDFEYPFKVTWQPGEHRVEIRLVPLVPVEQKKNRLDFRVRFIKVAGPMDESKWVNPEGYDRFFHLESPPDSPEQRDEYAADVLRRFASKAFRRPVEEPVLDSLVGLAQQVYTLPGKSFEDGIAFAMVAVLASPRFIFRRDVPLPEQDGETYPWIDEYSLASRLSYFLWSTMPDEELARLAERGELRENLSSQVDRMVNDNRFQQFIRNFTGQWLQSRDIEYVPIDVRSALGLPRRRRGEERLEFEPELRRAMRLETEMTIAYVIEHDRSVLEWLDSDYTFVNRKLAEHYNLPPVEGDSMRRVDLPDDSPRGGVLTQGTVLAVTSNPTRTSPVKRGVFILDNILGTPAPPAPPEVPDLKLAEERFTDRKPTMRELMELHRSQPLCNSCHARFDPLGMALENFNALGNWRDTEHDQPIDPSGQLITGESFSTIQELKHILVHDRRLDFYRCLTEKVMTYAIGRGLEEYDEYTIDRVVQRLDEQQGRFSALLMGIVQSAPFQKQRVSRLASRQRVELLEPFEKEREVSHESKSE